jgi:hypothetical protein
MRRMETQNVVIGDPPASVGGERRTVRGESSSHSSCPASILCSGAGRNNWPEDLFPDPPLVRHVPHVSAPAEVRCQRARAEPHSTPRRPGEVGEPRGRQRRLGECRSTKGCHALAHGTQTRSRNTLIALRSPFGWESSRPRGGRSWFHSGSSATAKTSSAPLRRILRWHVRSPATLAAHSRSRATSLRITASAVARTERWRRDRGVFCSRRSSGTSAAQKATSPARCERGSNPR